MRQIRYKNKERGKSEESFDSFMRQQKERNLKFSKNLCYIVSSGESALRSFITVYARISRDKWTVTQMIQRVLDKKWGNGGPGGVEVKKEKKRREYERRKGIRGKKSRRWNFTICHGDEWNQQCILTCQASAGSILPDESYFPKGLAHVFSPPSWREVAMNNVVHRSWHFRFHRCIPTALCEYGIIEGKLSFRIDRNERLLGLIRCTW